MYLFFGRRLEILLDTFTVKDVSAFGLDRILCHVAANTADGCFVRIRDELRSVCFAPKDQVRMTCHLPHAGEPGKIEKLLGDVCQVTHRLKMLE